jgi:hypothetical protein
VGSSPRLASPAFVPAIQFYTCGLGRPGLEVLSWAHVPLHVVVPRKELYSSSLINSSSNFSAAATVRSPSHDCSTSVQRTPPHINPAFNASGNCSWISSAAVASSRLNIMPWSRPHQPNQRARATTASSGLHTATWALPVLIPPLFFFQFVNMSSQFRRLRSSWKSARCFAKDSAPCYLSPRFLLIYWLLRRLAGAKSHRPSASVPCLQSMGSSFPATPTHAGKFRWHCSHLFSWSIIFGLLMNVIYNNTKSISQTVIVVCDFAYNCTCFELRLSFL